MTFWFTSSSSATRMSRFWARAWVIVGAALRRDRTEGRAGFGSGATVRPPAAATARSSVLRRSAAVSSTTTSGRIMSALLRLAPTISTCRTLPREPNGARAVCAAESPALQCCTTTTGPSPSRAAMRAAERPPGAGWTWAPACSR